MRKEITVNRLWNIIEILSRVKSREFEFDNIVSKFDEHNVCGTVCCAIGWVINEQPEDLNLKWKLCIRKDLWSKYRYNEKELIVVDKKRNNSLSNFEIIGKLSKYLGVSNELVRFLFYGIDTRIWFKESGYEVIKQVVKYWEDYVDMDYNKWDFDHGFYTISIQMKQGSKSNLRQVINGFRFIHYLIENNYIKYNYKFPK